MRFVLGMLAVLISLSNARAADSGLQAQRSCSRAANDRLGNTIIEGAATGACVGMVSTIWILGRHLTENARFCIPEGARPELGLKVFLKYLGDHPELLHEADVFLAIWAFREAWPCQKGKLVDQPG